MLSVASDNKNVFFKYVHSKRSLKGNIRLVLEEDHRDKKEVELFNAFLTSVFNYTNNPRAAQSPEAEEYKCTDSDFPFVDTEMIRTQMYQLYE